MFRWMNVAIADLEDDTKCVHRAYVDDEKDWNGWLCPLFEKKEADRMSAWLGIFDERLVYDEKEDSYNTTGDPDVIERFAGIDVDGMHLYPIGYGSWMWVESDI